MNFKADDYLAHHGVKGMRWRKHKYKLVKGADGKYHYIYDDAQSAAKSNKNSKGQTFRQARAEGKDKVVGKMSREYLQAKRANTGAKPLTETYLVPTKTADDGLLRTSKLRSTVLTGRSGEQKQREEKRESTRNKKQVEAFANDIKKSKEHTARTEEATARRSAAANQKNAQKASYPSSVKRTQEEAAIKRKKADSYRLADPRVESVEFYKDLVPGIGTVPEKIAVPKKIFRKGAYSLNRGGLRVTTSEETKKRLRRNKRKKTVADVKRFINGLVNRK